MLIKETPEDFVVEEVLDLKLKNKGDYIYFILEKKNWTTLKAIECIANQLKIPVKRFSFAGQKDRAGITRQYVSAERVSLEKLNQINLKDIKIEFAGYSDWPISLGSLKGNNFKIVVRNLDRPLQKVDFIVNYYDEQRFGGYRPNLHLVGKNYLLGKYEEAVKLFLLYPFENETKDYVKARKRQEKEWGKWHVDRYPKYLINERKVIGYLAKNPGNYGNAFKVLPKQLFDMIPQAYQSYIWNESLAQYLREKFEYREVEYSIGKLVFVNRFVDLDWPIIGCDSKLKGDEKRIIEMLMKKEGVWYDNFNKSLNRKAMVKVENFKLGLFNKQIQEVSFFLPKGAYATMVIKSL